MGRRFTQMNADKNRNYSIMMVSQKVQIAFSRHSGESRNPGFHKFFEERFVIGAKGFQGPAAPTEAVTPFFSKP
jgi:hypothetical protein